MTDAQAEGPLPAGNEALSRSPSRPPSEASRADEPSTASSASTLTSSASPNPPSAAVTATPPPRPPAASAETPITSAPPTQAATRGAAATSETSQLEEAFRQAARTLIPQKTQQALQWNPPNQSAPFTRPPPPPHPPQQWQRPLVPAPPPPQPVVLVQKLAPAPAPDQQQLSSQPPTTTSGAHSYISALEEESRAQLYNILAALDPYKTTPKEFIHLLVKAAMRDEEINKAIRRMNEDRIAMPHSWQPIMPQAPPPPQYHRRGPPAPPPVYYDSKLRGYVQINTAPNATVISHPPTSSQPGLPSSSITPAQGSGDGGGSSTSMNDSAIELDENEPPEPKEAPCNFTWVVDRTETHLGWTGNYDKTSEIRQVSLGYEVALKLQKLLKKMNAAMDKHVTFPNRVHILTVMREIIMATLETDSIVGKECRECAREFDNNFVAAVRKLTTNQKRRLKVLEGGKWVQELQELIDEANRQSLFKYLERALVLIDC